jgi:hypothetical protein
MRSLLTRLAVLGVIVAITGCAGPNTPVAVAGSPNNGQASGGNPQPNLTGPGGTGGGIAAAANTIAPLLIDQGTLGAARPSATYVGFNANAVDTQSAVQSAQDASPAAPAPTVPPNPNSAADLGSSSVVVTAITQSQVLVTSNQTYNLTYVFGGQTFDYSTLVAHFNIPAGTVPTSISAEYVSATLTTAGFDVRTACTGTIGAAFARFTCPIPAFDVIPATNTSGPNVVNPNASDVFVPTATKIYFVLNYAQPPGLAATTTVGIDNVYAIQ